MKLIINISDDVYTRLFDNGIQDNEIAIDDVCEMARALRIGTPYRQGKRGQGMNEQCKDCLHRNVCAYKEHYEDAVELYEKAREECGKYPWFICDINCIQYCSSEENITGKRGIEE